MRLLRKKEMPPYFEWPLWHLFSRENIREDRNLMVFPGVVEQTVYDRYSSLNKNFKYAETPGPVFNTPQHNAFLNAVNYNPSDSRLYIYRGGTHLFAALKIDPLAMTGAVVPYPYPVYLAFIENKSGFDVYRIAEKDRQHGLRIVPYSREWYKFSKDDTLVLLAAMAKPHKLVPIPKGNSFVLIPREHASTLPHTASAPSQDTSTLPRSIGQKVIDFLTHPRRPSGE